MGFLVVGESVVDTVTDGWGSTARPGGSPANVAVGLARLGEAVALVTELGADPGGDLLRRHFADAGVTVFANSVARTPSARATVGAEGSVSYRFELAWTLPPIVAPLARHVHIGSLGAVLPPGAEVVRALLTRLPAGTRVSYDPNCRPAFMGDVALARGAIERLVAGSTLVKVSEEDLGWLYPGSAVEEVARGWCATGPAAVVVTLGSAGSLAVVAGEVVVVASQGVEVVDTVGAGDAFMAGLLFSLRDREFDASAVTVAMEFASRVAALTCSRAGADPPWSSELGGD